MSFSIPSFTYESNEGEGKLKSYVMWVHLENSVISELLYMKFMHELNEIPVQI